LQKLVRLTVLHPSDELYELFVMITAAQTMSQVLLLLLLLVLL